MSSSMPIATTSALYPLRLRADLDRDAAYAYWAGPHAAIAARLPGLVEYNQYHFCDTDHGYWPATPTVGTTIPADWKADGMTEVRLPNLVRALRIPLHMREVLFDEQNVFEHLDKLLRLKAAPVSVSLPWGFNVGAVGMLPYLPLPTKLHTRILGAITPDEDEDAIDLAARVHTEMQRALTEMTRNRRPLLG
jgi:hypothetical protein